MRVFLLSEHFEPKISGTSSYSRHLIDSLSASPDIQLYFLCPSHGKKGEIQKEEVSDNCTLLRLGVNSDSEPQYTVEERNLLIAFVKKNLVKLVKEFEIDVVHLLYGYFLSEVIQTNVLDELGIKTVLTVHNIPPEECSISWRGDNLLRKLKDDIRKLGVGWINRKRLKKQSFHSYIAPSNYVKRLLIDTLPNANVVVVPHGGAELISQSDTKTSSDNSHLRLLTAGGVVPHKQQAWIPELASYLKTEGIQFEWIIIGPYRNNRYADYIQKKIKEYKVEDSVNLLGPVSKEELESAYANADAYIQLSREEGFCMTVLDALAFGKLVLATPVGAIVEMIESSDGILLDPDKGQIKKLLAHYLKILPPFEVDSRLRNTFKEEYNWARTAEKVINVYKE